MGGICLTRFVGLATFGERLPLPIRVPGRTWESALLVSRELSNN